MHFGTWPRVCWKHLPTVEPKLSTLPTNNSVTLRTYRKYCMEYERLKPAGTNNIIVQLTSQSTEGSLTNTSNRGRISSARDLRADRQWTMTCRNSPRLTGCGCRRPTSWRVKRKGTSSGTGSTFKNISNPLHALLRDSLHSVSSVIARHAIRPVLAGTVPVWRLCPGVPVSLPKSPGCAFNQPVESYTWYISCLWENVFYNE